MITRSGLASEHNEISQTGVTLFYTINPFGPSARRASRLTGARVYTYRKHAKSICTCSIGAKVMGKVRTCSRVGFNMVALYIFYLIRLYS